MLQYIILQHYDIMLQYIILQHYDIMLQYIILSIYFHVMLLVLSRNTNI